MKRLLIALLLVCLLAAPLAADDDPPAEDDNDETEEETAEDETEDTEAEAEAEPTPEPETAPKPRVLGWAVSGQTPAEAREVLLHGAPTALQRSGRYDLTVLPAAETREDFLAAMRESGLDQGVWLYTQTVNDRPLLNVWLTAADGAGYIFKVADINDGNRRPCDVACQLIWELFDLPPAPATAPLLRNARKAAKAGDYEAADIDYRRALIISEYAYAVYRELGAMWARAGKPHLAFMYFDKARQLNKRDYLSIKAIADLHWREGRREWATAFYEEAIDAGPRAPGLLIALARAYHEQRIYLVDAQRLLVEALEIDPGNRTAIDELIDIAERNEDWAVAAQTLQRLLDMGIGGDHQRWILSGYQTRAGDYPAAIATLADLLTRHPDDADMQLRYAWLNIELGEYAKAEPLLAQRLQTQPDDVEVLRLQARIYYQTRRFAEAASTLEKAVELRPYDESLQRLLSKAYELAGDLPGALAGYERALARKRRLTSDDLDRYVNLARRLGRLDQAAAALRKLAKNRRTRDERVLIALTLAKLESDRGRTDAAVAACRQGLSSTRNNPRLLFFLGKLHSDAGDADQADTVFTQLRFSNVEPQLLLAAAQVQHRAGRRDAATDLYGAAYRRNPSLTEAGLLYLEGVLLVGQGGDPGGLIAELDGVSFDDEQRELLIWLELLYAAEKNNDDYYLKLRRYALHFIANKPESRFDPAPWRAVVGNRIAEPRRAELRDLLDVFARKMTTDDFSAHYPEPVVETEE